MLERLTLALSNKHTAASAGVYFLSKTLPKILAIWFPARAADFKATGDQIAEIAVTYGFLMGQDAGKSATKDDLKELASKTANAVTSGDTTQLTKTP